MPHDSIKAKTLDIQNHKHKILHSNTKIFTDSCIYAKKDTSKRAITYQSVRALEAFIVIGEGGMHTVIFHRGVIAHKARIGLWL